MIKKKPTVYIDMDDTAVNYSKQLFKYKGMYPKYQFPQSAIGFFSTIEPMPGFIEAWKVLEPHYDLRFLTRPSVYNLNSYTEKAVWVRDYMGGVEALEKLNLCPDKSIVGEPGDYLIDDFTVHGQTEFRGEFMHFGHNGKYNNWQEVVDYLLNKAGVSESVNIFGPKKLGNCKNCGEAYYTAFEFNNEKCDNCLFN